MEFALLIIGILTLLALIVLIVLSLLPRKTNELSALRMELQNSLQSFSKGISDAQTGNAISQEQRFSGFAQDNAQRLEQIRNTMEQRMSSLEQNNEQKLEQIRSTMEARLTLLQQQQGEKLTQMQNLVDEKLQKTLETRITQSFRLVSEQLEQVYKGLGEMQAVASGVTDLKKVLSNVKTRGILGEVQLGAILQEILPPEQYEMNVATKMGSRDVVEFAIRLPGEGDAPVYLPIDSKFPGETYAALQDAYESGNPEAVKLAAAALMARIKAEAKDIRTKYVDPPNTTDFAILFLPFEGLYAEAVNRGLVEELQRTYRVNLAGPSTMAALLNSLQMGFRTLAIQKRSGEVWQVLGAVKTEFEKFGDVLEKSQTRVKQLGDELELLIGTRTRAINRKLRDVERLDAESSERLLNE